jgi:Protein of unknown function (DUF4236)
MGWRFHHRIKIAPGIWLNASKSGVSASVREGRGLTLNFKPGRGLRVTESIPGTGISYVQDFGTHRRKQIQRATIVPAKQQKRWRWWPFVAIIFVLWGILGHHGRHGAAPTSSLSAPEASQSWQHSGPTVKTAPTPSVEVRRALPVGQDPQLPRHDLTPGDVFSSVTVNDLRMSGYSRRVRNVPESERRAVFAAYGIAWADRSNYELDHLVSLEIGGSNSARNLWPEPLRLDVGGKDEGAITKDRLENKLGQLVRSGGLDLKEAQKEEAANWVEAYQRLIGPLPDFVNAH